MHRVEGAREAFTKRPISIDRNITMLTAVGFADIAPNADLRCSSASFLMLLGWGILAVPTGIVSAKFTAQRVRREPTTRACHEYRIEAHQVRATFCSDCGAALSEYVTGR